jgi:ribosomal protein L7/L12
MDNFLADYFFPLMGAGALIAIGLLFYIVRGQKSADTTAAGDVFEAVQPDIEAEVRMLVDFGNDAEAIRVLQQKIGFDLQDAKDVVRLMAPGTPVPMPQDGATPTTEDGTDAEARALASDGKLISAIKLVREKKGLGLKEAKAYVERL